MITLDFFFFYKEKERKEERKDRKKGRKEGRKEERSRAKEFKETNTLSQI